MFILGDSIEGTGNKDFILNTDYIIHITKNENNENFTMLLNNKDEFEISKQSYEVLKNKLIKNGEVI